MSVCEHLGALMGTDVCTNVFVRVSEVVYSSARKKPIKWYPAALFIKI